MGFVAIMIARTKDRGTLGAQMPALMLMTWPIGLTTQVDLWVPVPICSCQLPPTAAVDVCALFTTEVPGVALHRSSALMPRLRQSRAASIGCFRRQVRAGTRVRLLRAPSLGREQLFER